MRTTLLCIVEVQPRGIGRRAIQNPAGDQVRPITDVMIIETIGPRTAVATTVGSDLRLAGEGLGLLITVGEAVAVGRAGDLHGLVWILLSFRSLFMFVMARDWMSCVI